MVVAGAGSGSGSPGIAGELAGGVVVGPAAVIVAAPAGTACT